MISPIESGNIQRVIAATPDPILRSQIEQLIASERAHLSQPAAAIERLGRFVERSRAPNTLLSQWERSPGLLGTLLQALDIDSPAIEWLIDDPDSFEVLRLAAGRSPSSKEIQDRLLAEVQCMDDIAPLQSSLPALLKRFRRREILRIVFGLELHGMDGAWAQQQLTWVNDAIIVACFDFCIDSSHHRERDAPLPIAIFAHGTYGSGDTDFTTPCSLLVLSFGRHDEDGFRRVGRFREIVESFDPPTFRADWPLHHRLPADEEHRVLDMQRWIEWAQVQGDAELELEVTQIRFLAGNPSVGSFFLRQVESLFFERYRSRSEQASLASFLRKRDRLGSAIHRNIAFARYQIDTILFVLQWIHGSRKSELRFGTTSSRIEALAKHGCLSNAEHRLVSRTYAHVRKLQLLDQIRAGCVSVAPSSASSESSDSIDPDDIDQLSALVSQSRDKAIEQDSAADDEADLVYDPEPDPAWATGILSQYGFHDVARATALVRDLGTEDFRVLSTRRCRYYLSTIAARLLQRIGQTPTPDRTLENLSEVCRSIGAKGVLWELFSVHAPSMDLSVRLCGTSPYLVGILTSNPGMVDELIDSLMLNRLPTESHVSRLLDELCRGAQEIDSIVRSFKNAMHLSIGVRDILGKESISETHRALSIVADVSLQQWVEFHYNAMVQRYGEPALEDGTRCPFGLLALGKLGNREPNYHSDVVVLFLYGGSGATRPIGPVRYPQTVPNDFFFQQLSLRISQGVNRLTRFGRLFELRNWTFTPEPTAGLAWPLHQFESTLLEGGDDTMVRMELLSARPIAGDPGFQSQVRETIERVLVSREWTSNDLRVALRRRGDLERTARDQNLKRGRGGTMDVETISQILSLQHACHHTELIAPGTIDAIERLRRLEILSTDDALRLKDAYNFLRGVESGLRLMNTKARHDLPDEAVELDRLAFGLHLPSASQLIESCRYYREQAREILVRLIGEPDV